MPVLIIIGCGGTKLASSPTTDQPVRLDPETTRLWAGWATESLLTAATTARMYGSMLPDQAAEQQARVRTLAEEIRATEPSNETVLRLANDLDEIVDALEFALEYAENTGLTIIRIVIPGLEDALSNLVDDATELNDILEAQ